MLPDKRASGILLHPSSLPGGFGHGDFGPQAYRFVDWLASAGQHLWQILPLNPPGSGNSPYMSTSCFAGNPLLISPEWLHRDGYLTRAELDEAGSVAPDDAGRIDFMAVTPTRFALLRLASDRFFTQTGPGDGRRDLFDEWCLLNRDWVDDYALFMVLSELHGGAHWRGWPEPLRRRDPRSLASIRERFEVQINYWRFVQWQFDFQWHALKSYAGERAVALIGDCPIYCSIDSADVWQHPELFQLDENQNPVEVAGVPPDYFSETGQLWGNPLYDWPRHQADRFSWWVARMRRALDQTDIVRIDHFRALQAYWAVPAGATTAESGGWRPGPGQSFLAALNESIGSLPIIAEDLGTITPDVIALRDEFELPGMKVLQFAFGDTAENLYLPHNLNANCVIYTGTHDNDTSVGWFATTSAEERRRAQIYLKTDGSEIAWDLIHAASGSVARMAIYPLQDVLSLGGESRMNEPGKPEGQWSWRFNWDSLQTWHGHRLLEISIAHGRHA